MRALLLAYLLPVVMLSTLAAPAHARKGLGNKKLRKLGDRVDAIEEKLLALQKGTCQRRDCPFGYVAYKRSCFLFVMGQESAKPWSKAKEYCKSQGANLVTLSNARQLKFVEKYLEFNFNNSKSDISTGLIGTDYKAEKPFNPAKFYDVAYTRTKDSYRWTATKEAVVPDGRPVPHKPLADFHPVIHGPEFAQNAGYLSCVKLFWDPWKVHKHRLLFMFGNCESRQPFICEVRPPRKKCRLGLNRNRRSTLLRAKGKEGLKGADDDDGDDDEEEEEEEIERMEEDEVEHAVEHIGIHGDEDGLDFSDDDENDDDDYLDVVEVEGSDWDKKWAKELDKWNDVKETETNTKLVESSGLKALSVSIGEFFGTSNTDDGASPDDENV